MTKTLTEQWREGTLPKGLYYTRSSNGHKAFSFHTGSKRNMFSPYDKMAHQVEEVLALVTDYDEYLYLKTNNDHWNKEAIRISKQAIGIALERDELVQKIHTLEKELSDAKEYCDYSIKNREQLTKQINYWMDKSSQLEKTLDKIYEVRHIKGVSDSIEMFYNNLKEQIKEEE